MNDEYRLIGDIYDAVYDQSLMPALMASLQNLTQSDSAGFAAMDFLNPNYPFFAHSGFSSELLKELAEGGYHLQQFQVMGQQWMNTLPVGTASCSDSFWGGVAQYQAVGGSYVEFINRHGLFHQSAIVLERSDYRWVGIGLNNKAGRLFSPEGQATLQRLGSHFRRAMQIHRQLVETREHNKPIYRRLDAMPTGVILLGEDGRIRFMNIRAEELLRQNNVLKISGDHLRHLEPEHGRRLLKLIQGAIETSRRESRGNTGGVLPVLGGQIPLLLSITPLSELPDHEALRQDHVAAALFINNPAAGHQLSARTLTRQYGLTPREIDICQQFMNQPELEPLAASLGLTLHSLRSALKVIYEKTDQNSQAKLMRLLMGLRVNFDHII